MKYLGKTVTRRGGEPQPVDGFRAFAALLWVTGKRQYSASRALSAAMKPPGRSTPREDGREGEGGGWRFIGVAYGYPGWREGRYSGETATAIRKHLTSAVWKPPPYMGPRTTTLAHFEGDLSAN